MVSGPDRPAADAAACLLQCWHGAGHCRRCRPGPDPGTPRKEHPDEAKKIVEIHDNATKYVQENPDDSVSQLPKDIVANPDIEKKSLSGINFVSGLDDAYKQKVLDFMNIEVDLGVLKEKIPAEKIFYDVTA